MNAPDFTVQEWLTETEAAKYLKISLQQFRALRKLLKCTSAALQVDKPTKSVGLWAAHHDLFTGVLSCPTLNKWERHPRVVAHLATARALAGASAIRRAAHRSANELAAYRAAIEAERQMKRHREAVEAQEAAEAAVFAAQYRARLIERGVLTPAGAV